MATLKQVIEGTAALRGMTYPEIADWLGGNDLVTNPVKAAPMVPKAITRENIIALIPPAEAWAIYSAAGTLKDDLFAAIDADNRAWLTYLLGVAQASGKLTAGTLAALQAELQATVPDPAWAAMMPGPARWQTAGLAAAPTAADVQAALHEVS